MKRYHQIRYILLLLLAGISCSVWGQGKVHAENETLRITVFDVDATPPVGSDLTFRQMKNSWDLGLRAKGIVLTGAGRPTFCVPSTGSHFQREPGCLQQALAEVTETIPERVAAYPAPARCPGMRLHGGKNPESSWHAPGML